MTEQVDDDYARRRREMVESQLRRRGIAAGLFRPVTLWPFPVRALLPRLERARGLVVVEAGNGQLEDELRLALSHAGVAVGGDLVIGRVRHFGGVLPPMESFLVQRGIKTLALRMRRHCQSAARIAQHLEEHPEVEWVRYPGLENHPQYRVGCKQMTGGGAVISFGLKGGLEAGKRMMNALELCILAVSLGGVETLIQHPASMTHASMGQQAREKAHITDGLVRMSVGLEDPADLIADLTGALG